MAAAAEDAAQPTSSKDVSETAGKAEQEKGRLTEGPQGESKDTADGVKGKEAGEKEEKKVLALPPRALNPMEIEKLIYSLMEIPPSDFERRLPKV